MIRLIYGGGVALFAIIIYAALIALGLTPLWVWISNGYSINGGISNNPLSFGLGFIGTFIACGSLFG